MDDTPPARTASPHAVDDDTLAQAGWKPRALGGFIDAAGPLWTRREPEGWAYAFRTCERHLNPAGLVHGGALATLMDHALSTLAWEAAGRKGCVTLQLDTHFIAPVHSGVLVEARGHIASRSPGFVFMRGSLTVGAREVMSAQAILRILRT